MATTQLRLPRQAAAPDGPVDLSMMYVMHHAFRRDLAAFATAVPRTPVDDLGAWRAMHSRWGKLASALHHHHHEEDTWLWPALLERADESARTTLTAMEAEHQEIDPLLEACDAGLRAMARGGTADGRNALAVRVAAARASLGRHLEHEERDALRILQEVMTQEDWKALEANFGKDVAFSEIVRLVPWVLHEVPAEARQRLFAGSGSGLVHRVLWWLTRRGFERESRRAFRH